MARGELKNYKEPVKLFIIRLFGMTGFVVMKEEKIENVSGQKFLELQHSEKSVFQTDNFSTNIWLISITIHKAPFKNFHSYLIRVYIHRMVVCYEAVFEC